MWCVQTNATTANIVGDRLKKCMRVRRHFYKANIVAVLCLKRAQYCCATHRRSQNNKSWVWLCQKFDRFQTLCNKCKHCCGSMQKDATCWPNNVAYSCATILRPFARTLTQSDTPHHTNNTTHHNTTQYNTTRHDKDF